MALSLEDLFKRMIFQIWENITDEKKLIYLMRIDEFGISQTTLDFLAYEVPNSYRLKIGTDKAIFHLSAILKQKYVNF